MSSYEHKWAVFAALGAGVFLSTIDGSIVNVALPTLVHTFGSALDQVQWVVLYMTPGRGSFLASFALGEKAVRAAHASGLPRPVLDVVDAARVYAEGRGVRLEVRTADDVVNVEALAAVKMAN